MSNQTSNTRRNKRNKKKPVQLKRGEPTFLYLCDCHNERAGKTPCERSADDRQNGKHSESPLGTWQCQVSNSKCKVRRVKNKPVEGEEQEKNADIL
jgi:hypothetical protein